jgi:hypothetical protein
VPKTLIATPDPERRLTLIWDGDEAKKIRTLAKKLGTNPRSLVERGVDMINSVTLLDSLLDNDRPIIRVLPQPDEYDGEPVFFV